MRALPPLPAAVFALCALPFSILPISVAAAQDTLSHGLHVVRDGHRFRPSLGHGFHRSPSPPRLRRAAMRARSAYVYAANTIGAMAGALAVSSMVRVRLELGREGARGASRRLSSAIRRAWVTGLRPLDAALHPAWALGMGLVAAALLRAFLRLPRAVGWSRWVNPNDRYPSWRGRASTVAVHASGPGRLPQFARIGARRGDRRPSYGPSACQSVHLSSRPPPSRSPCSYRQSAAASAGALHPEVKRIVICGMNHVRRRDAPRAEEISVLDNPKVEVVFDDARHFLATTRKIERGDPTPFIRGCAATPSYSHRSTTTSCASV